MGSPRAIVSVKATRGGSGASGVARYIAESKVDKEREGDHSRPLFSEHHDGLTYRAANSLVSPDRDGPSKKDIIHMVISTTQEEYERLGASEEERLEALKEITRDTVKEIEKATNVEKLHWFAGIHRNTDNPHVHLAIGRDAVSRDTMRATRVEHLPRALLPHKEKSEDGQRFFVPGQIAERFVASLEISQQQFRDTENRSRDGRGHDGEAHEKTSSKQNAKEQGREQDDGSRQKKPDDRKDAPTKQRNSGNNDANGRDARGNSEIDNGRVEDQENGKKEHDTTWKDRYILGRTMVARGEVERLSAALKNAREHGDKRRFRIFDDSHNRTRRISEFDIKRRSDARAMREVTDRAILDKTKRHTERQNIYQQDVALHSHGITNHQTILQKTVKKLEGDLQKAQQEYGILRPRALAIKRDYELAGKQLPLPLISSKELTRLQDQAISAKNTGRLLSLEQIRQGIAKEQNVPSRSEREAARLQGQLVISRSDEKLREHRLEEFERNKHLTRWEIEGKKYSLAEVDKQLAQRRTEARFFKHPEQLIPTSLHSPGSEVIRLVKVLGRNTNLLPSRRRAAAAEVEKLTEVRGLIEERIEERRNTLQGEISQCAKLTETLATISNTEIERRDRAGQKTPAPLLTRPELNRLETNALAMKDTEMLRMFHALEAHHMDKLSESRRLSPEVMAGRAGAREILAEMSLRESQEKLAVFEERKEFAPVLVTDASGQDHVASAWDFRQERKLLHHLAVRAFEGGEKRQMRADVEKGLELQESRLNSGVEQARNLFEFTQTMADSFRSQFRSSGGEMPAPIFTPKEINALEIYAVKQGDQGAREHYEQMIESAEREGRVLALETEERDRDKGLTDHTRPPDPSAAASGNFGTHEGQAPVRDMDHTLGDDFTMTH
jgi:MobL relaxases